MTLPNLRWSVAEFFSPRQPVPPIPIPVCHIWTTTIFYCTITSLNIPACVSPLTLIMIDLERSVSSFTPCLAQFWVLLLPHTPQQLEAALIWCGLDRWDKTRQGGEMFRISKIEEEEGIRSHYVGDLKQAATHCNLTLTHLWKTPQHNKSLLMCIVLYWINV